MLSDRPRLGGSPGPTALALSFGAAIALAACTGAPSNASDDPASPTAGVPAPLPIIAADPDRPRPPFDFAPADAAFLDEIQRGCFNFFWNACSPTTGMVYDRTSDTVVSIAGVGFQLAALPIGVERGWVTRDEARARAELILRSLRDGPGSSRDGLFYHFLNHTDAGPQFGQYERVVSTIDSALLFAGCMVASSYFGGEVAALADALVDGANWDAFVRTPQTDPGPARGDESPRPVDAFDGFISLGWRLGAEGPVGGSGVLLPYVWCDAADEQRLTTFLAVGSRNEAFSVPSATYYRLRRQLGRHVGAEGEGPVFAWFPYSGALFTTFFAHCFIDYAGMGPDDPAGRAGVEHRARVDWWENSRRAALMHRANALANPLGLATPGEHAWGLTACDGQSGAYLVPGLLPEPVPMPGARTDWDVPAGLEGFKDNWENGTIALYGAGSTIMFEPGPALASLRYARALRHDGGGPLVWVDPAAGGYGFRDSYNLDVGGKAWAAEDFVAIDQGPMMLAIENARTGLVWRLFHEHAAARRACERLGMSPGRGW